MKSKRVEWAVARIMTVIRNQEVEKNGGFDQLVRVTYDRFILDDNEKQGVRDALAKKGVTADRFRNRGYE